ncbi:MAG: YebC/PmpR family DNA-binding transcriptional regulator [Flavobacteriales bacterium]|nr:MAG: YebC/PmpR family DNA-binding transcriptional regulator [Flavobacteriales bacterium]
MGRVFEKRKHTMFARFDRMAKQFTRYGKEIAIAVKQGGPNPDYNPKLRTVIQNAKAVNMPKDRVDAAIKRASSKSDSENYEEVRFEGYAPHGVGVLVETATDNNTRTVANVRMHFNKGGGAMGKTGALDFIFTRKGVIKIAIISLGVRDLDDLELALIDCGLEDIATDDDYVYLYSDFSAFGQFQKHIEDQGIEITSSELQYIPNTFVDVNDDQAKEVLDLIDRLEGDDDVQNVYHNLR